MRDDCIRRAGLGNTSRLLRWKAETVPFFYEKQTLATVGITSALCQEQTSYQ
jgi:hypothetical protein